MHLSNFNHCVGLVAFRKYFGFFWKKLIKFAFLAAPAEDASRDSTRGESAVVPQVRGQREVSAGSDGVRLCVYSDQYAHHCAQASNTHTLYLSLSLLLILRKCCIRKELSNSMPKAAIL